MKLFRCRCGTRVYFENTRCLTCHSELGFDPGSLDMVALPREEHRRCRNHAEFGNCNWLVHKDEADHYCPSCRLNRTIPSLELENNRRRWRILENAKRRLLYSLLSLGLPVKSKVRGWPEGLAFDFIEDQASNPSVAEPFVATGHRDGVITINIAEADDVYRVQMRLIMDELYRTVMGHFRHESGHYYFYLLVTEEEKSRFRELFGDERTDYDQALSSYYAGDRNNEWRDGFISAYASAHPLEDWAETWAHYLLITDALETLSAEGWTHPTATLDRGLDAWTEAAIKLNQVSRGLGLEDPYPFVINAGAREKLLFVEHLLEEQGL